MARTVSLSGLVCIGLLAASVWAGSPGLDYPETQRGEQTDLYHGVKVADPYRWLEADVRKSDAVADWVRAQNKLTFRYLKGIPERPAIRERLTELWDHESYSSPFKAGRRYYYYKNDGLQDHKVLYTMDSLDGKPRVLLDPNTWAKDGTVALAGTSFSDDGRFMAYALAEAGSDWRTWRVMEIESGKLLDDELRWVKFSGTSWTPDGRGFFYGRFDRPEKGDEFQSLNLNHKLYYHRVGTSQSQDVLVYQRPDHPDWGFDSKVTEDGRYLVITVWKGTDSRYRVLYKDLTEPYGMPLDLIDSFENEYTFVTNDGPIFYFKTDLEAPKGRLLAVDLRRPLREHWTEIVPESEQTLRSFHAVGNMVVGSYLKDARTEVRLYRMDGSFVRKVELPAIGSASGFKGKRGDTETFYSFSSFATPKSIYRYDMISGKSTLMRSAEVDFDPDAYQVKQVFYQSKDGTRVPMFIAHRKGLKLNSSNPTLLYGYGGFNAALQPSFSISRLAWMEMGGVFAMANLRGGGEYGEQWHQAGTRLQKQNVFDDFIAAAEWLIENRYTRTDKLAVQGGSNGGLLVGAVMTQRPELFGACLPAKGVMDMLRYHLFTAGRYWVDDYGSAEDPAEFEALREYSPVHNVKPDTRYPATLITTADYDDRVVPAHSFKFAAALQNAQAGSAPVLVRIASRAGHGAGTPTSKLIERIADQWAFLVHNLKMKPPK